MVFNCYYDSADNGWTNCEYSSTRVDIYDTSTHIWSTAELKQLRLKCLTEKPPRHDGHPIIVFEFKAVSYVVDGRRRVNKALRENFSVSHDLIIISICTN